MSSSSVKYCQRIVSVALEAARKYNYIVSNPAQNIITKFGKQGKTPDPFTILAPEPQKVIEAPKRMYPEKER